MAAGASMPELCRRRVTARVSRPQRARGILPPGGTRRFIKNRQGRDKHHGCIARPREQHPIGVQAKPERILDHPPLLVPACVLVRPAPTFTNEVSSPCQERGVKLKALRSELGDALPKGPTGASEVVAIPFAVPGPEVDAFRRLKVVVDADLGSTRSLEEAIKPNLAVGSSR